MVLFFSLKEGIWFDHQEENSMGLLYFILLLMLTGAYFISGLFIFDDFFVYMYIRDCSE